MFSNLGTQLSKPSGFLGRIVARIMENGNKKCYEKSLSMLDVKDGEKVFEIGYGPGYCLNHLANTTKNCFFGGIDYSELMFKKASQRNQRFIKTGIMNLSFGDLLTADLTGQKYNKVFCTNVVYFWSDLSKAFEKVYSILEDSGMYFIYMAHPDYLEKLKFTENFNKHTIEKVETELKRAGFKSVEYILDEGCYLIKAFKEHRDKSI